MDITGIIHFKSETQIVSEKFQKREVVITESSSKYPQHISFQLTQDKVSLIDQYNVGDEIKVHFNIRGKEWISPQGEKKYFNTLEIWRIEGGQWKSQTNESDNNPSNGNSLEGGDDLPF